MIRGVDRYGKWMTNAVVVVVVAVAVAVVVAAAMVVAGMKQESPRYNSMHSTCESLDVHYLATAAAVAAAVAGGGTASAQTLVESGTQPSMVLDS